MLGGDSEKKRIEGRLKGVNFLDSGRDRWFSS